MVVFKDIKGGLRLTSMIDRMTGVRISSPYFSETTLLEFFPKHAKAEKNNRAALLFGRNGSGKSMIAQGFRDYRDSVNPPYVTLEPMEDTSPLVLSPEDNPGKIFIFDEKYISNRVKVKDSGLDAIVLFGDQVGLNKQIEKVQGQIKSVSIEILEQQNRCDQFTDKNNPISPDFWTSKIKDKLHKPNGWAEIGSVIKGQKQNLNVTVKGIELIGNISPTGPLNVVQGKRDVLLAQYSAAATSSIPIRKEVTKVTIIRDINERVKAVLEKVVNKPQLTNREQLLLQLFGVTGATNARFYVSKKENTICDKCFQPISEEYRVKVLNEIECILNQEIEEFKSELEGLLISELPTDIYQIYRNMPSYENLIASINDYNKIINVHNSIIKEKMDNPFEPIIHEETTEITAACKAVNEALDKLEEDRINFNRSIDKKEDVRRELLQLNNVIGHYDIEREYVELKKQRTTKQEAEKRLHQLKSDLDDLTSIKAMREAESKSFTIAADEINKALEYIFFSKSRLSLELGADQLYHLKVNGNKVKPDKISCGERNALALCYFFTEIAKDMDAKTLYSDEIFLVIDDPVSSFDIENKIGIMSFLRWKLEQVLSCCDTTKILVMTHDISVMINLTKVLGEISKRCKRVSSDYLFKLDRKCLSGFSYRTYNEYTQLLEMVYNYASKDSVYELDLVIGNVMRRVLEAFGTFSFKLGIDQVSSNDRVLALLPEEVSTYYRSLMSRLVLNNESHFEDDMRGAPETGFFSLLSPEEKRRTAKDILCFIYQLNKTHLLSHLSELTGAESDILAWCSAIGV